MLLVNRAAWDELSSPRLVRAADKAHLRTLCFIVHIFPIDACCEEVPQIETDR